MVLVLGVSCESTSCRMTNDTIPKGVGGILMGCRDVLSWGCMCEMVRNDASSRVYGECDGGYDGYDGV